MQDNNSLYGKLSRWVAQRVYPLRDTGPLSGSSRRPQRLARCRLSKRGLLLPPQLLVCGTTHILWRGGGQLLTRALCCSFTDLIYRLYFIYDMIILFIASVSMQNLDSATLLTVRHILKLQLQSYQEIHDPICTETPSQVKQCKFQMHFIATFSEITKKVDKLVEIT